MTSILSLRSAPDQASIAMRSISSCFIVFFSPMRISSVTLSRRSVFSPFPTKRSPSLSFTPFPMTSSSSWRSFLCRSISRVSIDRLRWSFSTPRLANTFASITIPWTPGGTLKDVSLTSPALSPKIALKSFSSGES